MEFKTELKTKDGKVIPKESIWKPQEAACRLMADAIRRKHRKEEEEKLQKQGCNLCWK